MKSLNEFIKKIPKSFLEHIRGNTYVEWKFFPADTKVFLKEIFDSLRNGTYAPSPPRDYVVSNKHNAVARIVPSMTLVDYCVYYYCIASVEKFLAKNRTEGTFGGFRLGGYLRKREEKEFEAIQEIPFSVPPFTYNPIAWFNAWLDFQKKAYIYSREDDYEFFLRFDIANFYNTINLTILERKIRLACAKNVSEEIDILFFFLKYWNKKFLLYGEQTVSIPQDEVGDCSRILANFYLQDYDQVMSKICKKRQCRYMRYSDDQVIMSNNHKIAQEVLFLASKELFKLGLNINSAKVQQLNKDEWDYYWCFDVFNLLGQKNNKGNIEQATKLTLELDKSKCRYGSVLSRLITCNLKTVSFDLRMKILAEIVEESYLADCNERALLRIYQLLEKPMRKDYLERLKLLSKNVQFNSFHYHLLRAQKKGLPISSSFEKYLIKRIEELKLS